MNNHLVIMAGGVGSRFWPMSTSDRPKQFIDILGVGKSLLQLTFARFSGICEPSNVWIVTNKKYFNLIREQLPEVLEDHRSEEHTSELQSRQYLVCRLLLEKKKKKTTTYAYHTPT